MSQRQQPLQRHKLPPISKPHRHAVRLLGVAVLLVLLGSAAVLGQNSPHAAAAANCVFLSNSSATPAFCDSFNAPAGTGNRSGDLNGTVWGVSRVTGNQNSGLANGWFPTTLNLCGTTVTVQPENDVRICGGHVAEATNDGGNVTSLAMYPKQPFDIAGRTGTAVFDVTDDSQGTHAAWPEFWYTDQPVPTPFQHESTFLSVPRNGIGIRFAASCGAGKGSLCAPNCSNANAGTVVTVDSADVVTNYQPNDSFSGGSLRVQDDNCIVEGSAGANTFNHIEVRLNATSGVDVYGTDAFTPGSPVPSLKHLAHISTALPLSRGLVWFEDAHYNGDKFNTQGTHTFYWDNIGFDGPVLPRDRSFDVLDNSATGNSGRQLGWFIPGASSVSVHTVPIDQASLANATGAALLYGWWSEQSGFILTVSVNGHVHAIVAPFSGRAFSPNSLAVPLPLSDLVAGVNTITFTTPANVGLNVFNINLVAIGGGGGAGQPPTPPPTATATATPPATPPATPTPISINNVPCTVTLNGVTRSGTCSGRFTP